MSVSKKAWKFLENIKKQNKTIDKVPKVSAITINVNNLNSLIKRK